MKVFVQMKSAGKRRPVLEKREYELHGDISTLKDIILAVVNTEVSAYNAKGVNAAVTQFLTEPEIEDVALQGKIGFGKIYSDKKADEAKAREVALQAFEDGLFRVFINDIECTRIDAPSGLCEGDTLTFIRFTFLSGRLW